MKKCKKCNELLCAASFYRDKEMRDGRKGTCKRCARSGEHARYAADVEARRLYGALMNVKRQESGYLASYRRSPEKEAAKRAVHNAKRAGRLVPQPCKVCGAGRVDAHHPDYAKPLEVVWLCRRHHMEWHRMDPPAWAVAHG